MRAIAQGEMGESYQRQLLAPGTFLFQPGSKSSPRESGGGVIDRAGGSSRRGWLRPIGWRTAQAALLVPQRSTRVALLGFEQRRHAFRSSGQAAALRAWPAASFRSFATPFAHHVDRTPAAARRHRTAAAAPRSTTATATPAASPAARLRVCAKASAGLLLATCPLRRQRQAIQRIGIRFEVAIFRRVRQHPARSLI